MLSPFLPSTTASHFGKSGCRRLVLTVSFHDLEAHVTRTLYPAYRVTNLAASLDFYTALGYDQVGRVDIGDGAARRSRRYYRRG